MQICKKSAYRILLTSQYIEMPTLTPELIRVFIKRIEVFEKAEKYSRTCGNRVIIYFTFQADKGTKIDVAMVEFSTKENLAV